MHPIGCWIRPKPTPEVLEERRLRRNALARIRRKVPEEKRVVRTRKDTYPDRTKKERQARWYAKNPKPERTEAYRAYHREWMRKYRAKKNA